ncbi:MAG TPA: thiamine phosphate synthase, partial [Thermoanaerobaculia bacterium]|nr:thiamine phosphate synthase [Thermoanaerobaculia bacterium]
SAREAVDAIASGADLVVIGPIFATPSKAALGAPLGPDALADLPRADEHGRDVLAIGGVSEANLAELAPWRDRITGVAGIRLFQESDDPASVVRRIAAQ